MLTHIHSLSAQFSPRHNAKRKSIRKNLTDIQFPATMPSHSCRGIRQMEMQAFPFDSLHAQNQKGFIMLLK
jgi:hypothetical protein